MQNLNADPGAIGMSKKKAIGLGKLGKQAGCEHGPALTQLNKSPLTIVFGALLDNKAALRDRFTCALQRQQRQQQCTK